MNTLLNLNQNWDDFFLKSFEGAGPTGTPRGGKYISREWVSDHWEYEYADEPKSAHGIQNASHDSHSMNLPSKMSDSMHQRAQAGDQEALKQIYEASRGEAKGSLQPGQKFEAINPVTGGKMQVSVRSDGAILAKLDQPVFGKKTVSGTGMDWDSFNTNMRKLALSKEIKDDASGLSMYVVPAGNFDENTNKFTGLAEKNPKLAGSRVWEIKAPKGSPIKVGSAKGRSPSKQQAERKARLLMAIHNRAKTSVNVPAMQQVAQGLSATDALRNGTLPSEVIGGKQIEHRLENKFQSPEEKQQFIQQLYKENEKNILELGQKMPVAPTPEQINTALEYVVRKYDPTTEKRPIEDLIAAKIGWQAGDAARKQKGEVSLSGEGQGKVVSDMAAQQASDGDDEQTEHEKSQEQHQKVLDKLLQMRSSNPKLARIFKLLKQDANVLVSPETSGLSFDEKHKLFAKQAITTLHRNGIGPDQIEKVFAGISKSLHAAWLVSQEDILIKAIPEYDHKEGLPENPRFYFTDKQGNYIRYTNAPSFHDDHDKQYGEPSPHASEPTFETAPQFFTPDGRKLTRAPYTGATVEWNPSYHRNDPKNLWAARWVNPVSGEHEYTYIDSDIRDQPNLQIHRINALVDVRIPIFRQYVSSLIRSNFIKDQVTGVMLALLDQGRFRIRELIRATVGDLKVSGNIVYINKRGIHTDFVIQQKLLSLAANRLPTDILFTIPTVGEDGGLDYTKLRRVGMHYIINILEELGIPIQALQTYHASQSYSVAIQNVLTTNNVSWECAHHFALLEVAMEMNHDLDKVDDYEVALQAIENSAIDPVVIKQIKQTCEKLQIGINGTGGLRKPIHSAIHRVSSKLIARTEDEEEFSRWLRTSQMHNFAEMSE